MSSAAGYRHLAAFRFHLRRFLVFSERAAKRAGIEPQQHQLLLSIKGLPPGSTPNIRTLAERLALRHHTVVELVDRLERRGLVTRRRAAHDRREALVTIAPAGDAILRRLSSAHRAELRSVGPELVRSLVALSRSRARRQASRPALRVRRQRA